MPGRCYTSRGGGGRRTWWRRCVSGRTARISPGPHPHRPGSGTSSWPAQSCRSAAVSCVMLLLVLLDKRMLRLVYSRADAAAPDAVAPDMTLHCMEGHLICTPGERGQCLCGQQREAAEGVVDGLAEWAAGGGAGDGAGDGATPLCNFARLLVRACGRGEPALFQMLKVSYRIQNNNCILTDSKTIVFDPIEYRTQVCATSRPASRC
jgi:hypothetical protein